MTSSPAIRRLVRLPAGCCIAAIRPKNCARTSYEEVAYLILYGELPKRDELTKFTARLRCKRRFLPS